MKEKEFEKFLSKYYEEKKEVNKYIKKYKKIVENDGELENHCKKDECKKIKEKYKNNNFYRNCINMYLKFYFTNNNKNTKIKNNNSLKYLGEDSYSIIFNEFFKKDIENFYKFGIDNTIFVPKEEAKVQWDNLIDRLEKNEKVYIRGYGRKSINSDIYIKFYEKLFEGKNIVVDATNNNAPRNNIEKATGYKINGNIFNYQCSHIIDNRTKNPLLFEALWNICLIPKIYDPFTGHESNGIHQKNFKKLLENKLFEEYKELIDEYNEYIRKNKITKKINQILEEFKGKYSDKVFAKFEESVKNTWKEIKKEHE